MLKNKSHIGILVIILGIFLVLTLITFIKVEAHENSNQLQPNNSPSNSIINYQNKKNDISSETNISKYYLNQDQLTTNPTVIKLGVAALGDHNCVITSEGGVKCWGYNDDGQIGDNTIVNKTVPTDVIGLSSGILDVSGGSEHTCALTNEGGVKCWGNNGVYQLGTKSVSKSSVPIDVTNLSSGASSIAVGGFHNCVITDLGEAKCWGKNDNGQLGNNSTTNTYTPTNVVGLSNDVIAIAAGWYHTCALIEGGVMKCWGLNNHGQLGNDSTIDSHVPVTVTGLGGSVSAMALGQYNSCALLASGGVKCWGYNNDGQLGNNSTTESHVPVNVFGLTSGVKAISSGGGSGEHNCALTDEGGVKCWGNNSNGKLGNDSTTISKIPVNVKELTSGVSSIGAGARHTCALILEGIRCWGANDRGQLGNNTTTESHLPVDVIGLSGIGTDLSIDNVIPVQVIEEQNLVKDKATAIKVTIHKTGTIAITNVQASVMYSDTTFSNFFVAENENLDINNSLKNDQTVYPLNFPAGESTKIIYFFDQGFTPQSSTFIVSATVDTQNIIIEKNEDNNFKRSAEIPVIVTNWSGIWFPNLHLHYMRVDWENNNKNIYNDYIDYTDNFITGVYPIAESKYESTRSNIIEAYTNNFRVSNGLLNEDDLARFIWATEKGLRLASLDADRFIGVVPPHWFTNITTGTISSYYGVAIPGLNLVIAESRNTPRPNGPSIPAHEVGHSYNLALSCEEYDICNSTRLNNIGNFASAGLWVTNRIPIQPDNRNIYCFMGAYSDNEYWIDSQDYSTLLISHTLSSTTNEVNYLNSNQAILAVGIISKTGSITLDNWYTLPNAELDNFTPGPYSFVYLDNSDNVLQEIPFDVSFSLDTGSPSEITLNESPFLFTIPFISGTTKIQIKNIGDIVAEKLVSSHSPVVSIQYPNGGEVLEKLTTLEWSGNDTDGDTLYYTVLVSHDNGINWEPLAIDITENTLIWDTSQAPSGNNYLIKVIATDGINTGSDVSDSPFTILNFLYLPVLIR